VFVALVETDSVPIFQIMANGREENSFGGRMARYARVSTAMGGLAARVAGERYLGMRFERGEQGH
jgi:hypothetical protein